MKLSSNNQQMEWSDDKNVEQHNRYFEKISRNKLNWSHREAPHIFK